MMINDVTIVFFEVLLIGFILGIMALHPTRELVSDLRQRMSAHKLLQYSPEKINILLLTGILFILISIWVSWEWTYKFLYTGIWAVATAIFLNWAWPGEGE